jgi:lipopolysaccharide transport system ATP-binding protein
VTDDTVLTLSRVSKAYPRWPAGTRTLRDLLLRRLPTAARRSRRLLALRDVSLELRAGDAVGVVGANGAGKSTLLRLAAGLGEPTRGSVDGTPDRAAVLSLGASFDPLLSGEENAVTAAMVMGLGKADAVRLLPNILAFGELETFARAPVRTYSEGMRLRLAFAVVAQLEPQLLVIDEVLAVGDLRFQEKCLARVRELRERGTALLFASHDLDQVATECERAVWLHGGVVRRSGLVQDVLAAYRQAMHSTTVERTPSGPPEGQLELRRNRLGSQEVKVSRVRLLDRHGVPTTQLAPGAELHAEFLVEPVERDTGAVIGLTITRSDDQVLCYQTSTADDAVRVPALREPLVVRVTFPELALVAGDYRVSVGAYAPDWSYAYDYHWEAYPLRIAGPSDTRGVFLTDHEWSFERARGSGS